MFNKKLKEEIKRLKEQLTMMVEDDEKSQKTIIELSQVEEKLIKENEKLIKTNGKIGGKQGGLKARITELEEKLGEMASQYSANIELLNKEYRGQIKTLKSANTRLTNKLKVYEETIGKPNGLFKQREKERRINNE